MHSGTRQEHDNMFIWKGTINISTDKLNSKVSCDKKTPWKSHGVEYFMALRSTFENERNIVRYMGGGVVLRS